MRRYSREFLLRNPHLRGKDIETTRNACEKFRHIPTTVINFVEGTRFTEPKRDAARSRYRHLMPPKAAGLAFTLAAMGEQFDSLINVTISYPDNAEAPFRDFLMGRMKRIRVRIEELPVDEALVGDYFNDKQFKRGFSGLAEPALAGEGRGAGRLAAGSGTAAGCRQRGIQRECRGQLGN